MSTDHYGCTSIEHNVQSVDPTIERLHERIAQSVLYLPVDLSMRAECMHEK